MTTLRCALPPSLGRAKAEARAEMLQTALAHELGKPVTVHITGEYGEIEQGLREGQFALAWAPAAVCARLGAVRGVYTVQRRGQSTYLSAILARRSASMSLSTLKGARAVWVDPLSVGGYLLAVAKLRAEGIDPDRTFGSQVFLGSHRAVVEAVLHESADITAVSMPTADAARLDESLRWYAGPVAARLVPIAFTERCPNDALVLSTSLPEADARRFEEKLAARGPSSRLLVALEAEGLVKADLADYRRLSPLLSPTAGRRLSIPPGR